MALLDHNGVYGAARFHTAATRNDIRPHVGAEIGVPEPRRSSHTADMAPQQAHRGACPTASFVWNSRSGYQNLYNSLHDSSYGSEPGGDGTAKLEEIQDYSRGLVCLTGGGVRGRWLVQV